MAEKITVINQSTGEPIEFEPVEEVQILKGPLVNPNLPHHPILNPIDESRAESTVVSIVPAERTSEAIRRAKDAAAKAKK